MVIPASPASPHSILSFPDAVFAFPAQGVCFCFPCIRCSFLLSLHKVLFVSLHKASSCSVCTRSEHPFQRVVCTRFPCCVAESESRDSLLRRKFFIARGPNGIGRVAHNIRSRRPRTGLASVRACITSDQEGREQVLHRCTHFTFCSGVLKGGPTRCRSVTAMQRLCHQNNSNT